VPGIHEFLLSLVGKNFVDVAASVENSNNLGDTATYAIEDDIRPAQRGTKAWPNFVPLAAASGCSSSIRQVSPIARTMALATSKPALSV
jgi:hypothetical protein